MPGMQPIRWDNVNGGTISDAARILDSAGQSINGTFDKLGSLLKERESIDAANWQNTKTNNTTGFLNNLYAKYTDANALQEGIKSGDIARQIAGYGYQIDSNAVRGAADARLSQLQQQGMQNITYNHAVLDEAQAGTRDRLLGMLKSGDKAQIDAAMKELPGTELRIKQDLYEQGNKGLRQIIDYAHADESHKWEGDKLKGQLAAWQSEAGYRAGQLKLEGERIGLDRQRLSMDFSDRLQQRYEKSLENLGADPKSSIASPAGASLVSNYINSLKGDAQDVARRAYAKALEKDPTMPASAALTGLATARDQKWYETRNGIADDVVTNIVAAASSAATKEYQQKAEGQYANRLANADSLRLALGRAREAEAAGFAGKPGTPAAPGKGGGYTAADGTSLDKVLAEATAKAAKATEGLNEGEATPLPKSNQKTVDYRPAAPAVPTIQQAVENDPQVKQLRDTLNAINAKKPENRSIEDRRQLTNAQAMLQEALARAAREAQDAAAARSLPQIDPQVVSAAVNQVAMTPFTGFTPFNLPRR